MKTLLFVILSMGPFNSLGYLSLIFSSTAKGMSSDRRSSLVLNLYMYCGFNSAVCCTVIMYIPMGCK